MKNAANVTLQPSPPNTGRRATVRIWGIKNLSITLNRRQFFAALAVVVFSVAIQIPDWPAIFEAAHGHPMTDREVYKTSIVNLDLRIDYLDYITWTDLAINEWTWGYLLRYMEDTLGLEPERIFTLLTTFVIWQFASYVVRNAGAIYLIFLLNPLVIDLAFSQYRVALALSVVMFVLSEPRGKLVTALTYLFCTTIHTATVLFAVMQIGARLLQGRQKFSVAVLCGLGVLISFAIGPLRQELLGAVGDRRAEYEDMGSSFAYLSFWVLLWFMFLVKWRDVVRHYDGRYAIIVLSLVAANLFTGGYSTRFLAASLPSLIVAMSRWRSNPISVALLFFVPYSLVQWYYWFQI